MQVRATVLALDHDRAVLRVEERAGGCGRCDEPGGCRSAKLTHAFAPPREEFTLPNRIAAVPGQQVLVQIAEGAALYAALAAYALPVLLLLVGAGLGAQIGSGFAAGGDLPGVLGGLCGLLLGVLGHRVLARSRRWRHALEMTLISASADQPSAACRHEEVHR